MRIRSSECLGSVENLGSFGRLSSFRSLGSFGSSGLLLFFRGLRYLPISTLQGHSSIIEVGYYIPL
jgi:hypothetical protein